MIDPAYDRPSAAALAVSELESGGGTRSSISTQEAPPNTTDLPSESTRDPAVLDQSEIRDLRWQRFLGWLAVFPIGYVIYFLLRFSYRFKIKNHKAIREKFGSLAKSNRPLIICANHLTMIDSIVLLWAFGSVPAYFRRYRTFCWNIPAVENFKCHLGWRIVTYLSKCIAVDRSGSIEHIELVLAKIRYLLRRGERCMIFPEGTRSRTGRITVETVSYGIGKIIKELPGCDVLCVYLRGASQDSYSHFPVKGETFSIDLELMAPVTKFKGLRAVRDYSAQVISRMKQMENRYFAQIGMNSVESTLACGDQHR